jgi:hypothetical protein
LKTSKAICALLVCLAIGGSLGGQDKPPLQETLTWMKNGLGQHGFMMVNNKLVQTTNIVKIESCTITVEHVFGNAGTPKDTKRRTESVMLGDLDPNSVHLETNKYSGSQVFLMIAERSDSSPKIEVEFEKGDGSKEKLWVAQESFVIDSNENAQRFGTAFTHAITLCGGKPAPF